MTRRAMILRSLPLLAGVGALSIAAYFMHSNAVKLDFELFRVSFSTLAFSLAAFFIHMVMQGVLWHWLSRKCDVVFPFADGFRVWTYSQLGKYVPGKIARLGYLALAYRRSGAQIHQISALVLLEFLGNFSGVLIVVLVSALFVEDSAFATLSHGVAAAAAGAAVFSLIVIHPHVLNAATRLVGRAIRREYTAFTFRYVDVLVTIPFYAISLFFLCASNWLLFKALLGDTRVPSLSLCSAIFGLANLSGWLAFFSPGGLGAREAVSQLGLQTVVGAPLASALTLASRVWLTLCECVFVLSVWIVSTISGLHRRARQTK